MPEGITSRDSEYALELVRKICSEVGPGLPASPQERQRAEIIKSELETHLGVENVGMEEFTLAPGAFLSTTPGVICMFVAALLNVTIGRFTGISPWITSLMALLFALITPVSFILEFLLCREATDPLYPKKQSINLIGRLHKPGSGNVMLSKTKVLLSQSVSPVKLSLKPRTAPMSPARTSVTSSR